MTGRSLNPKRPTRQPDIAATAHPLTAESETRRSEDRATPSHTEPEECPDPLLVIGKTC
ncbi:MAG: hypothetical protein H6971_07980 [Gammaproteobacteria bacterium]|nr:hypothetical protein [Gammaproteobacteria bacterium]